MGGKWIVTTGAFALCACGPGSAEPPVPTAAGSKAATCAATVKRLPGSGLCETSAAAMMPPPEKIWEDTGQCRWVLSETALRANQWLLYRALSCKEGTIRLEYAGSAQRAELKVVSSAFGPASLGAEPWIIAQLIPAEPDGITAIRTFARAAMVERVEAARCDVRKAGFEGWPADALVVDVGAEEAAKAAKDEPRTACGEYGLDEDTASFWRVVGPYSVYFNLGQEMAQVDAGSLVVVQGAN